MRGHSKQLHLWMLMVLMTPVAGADIVITDTWRIETLDAAGDVDAWADLALDADGDPHICAQNRFYGNLNYHWRDAVGWHYDIVEHNDTPYAGRIALDLVGQPYVFYTDTTTWRLTLAHRAGGAWQLEYPIEWELLPDPTGVEMLAWDVAVDPGTGIPQICYTWRQTEDPAGVRIAWATRVPDGVQHPWTVTVVADKDADGLEGVNASLALGPDNVPRISFFDEGAQDLLLWTADPPGPADPIQTAGTVGRYNSLAVDGSGATHVIYTDETAETLNYLHGGVEVVSPVGAYTQVRLTSLALDGLGRPHATFVDERTQDLMYGFRDGAGHWRLDRVDHVGPYPAHQAIVVDGWNNPRLAFYAFGNLKYAVRSALTGDLDGSGTATVRDLLTLEHAAAGRLLPGILPCAYPLAGDFDGSGGPSAADRPGMGSLLAEN